MTKPSLYARAAATLQLVVCTLVAPITASPPQDGCRSCLLPAVTPPQAASLPERLDGLDLLVMVTAGREQEAEAALATIAARGGRAGFLVDVRAERPESPDDFAFTLKKYLATLRGRAGSAKIGIAVEPPLLEALLSRELAPYVDFVAAAALPSRQQAPAPGVARWGWIEATDLTTALDATRVSPIERWVWRLPRDADVARLVAELAAPSSEFAEQTQVVGRRQLTAAEIVARHQAVAVRQDAAITDLISTGHLTITFEAPGFPAPVTISAETIVYTNDERTDLEQRRIRVNGIEFKSGAVPRLPIIEPERAAAPPLAITLSNVYRYQLIGEDTVDGVRCYVVAFEPAPDAGGTALFRGRAWIAADSFAMVKAAAAQTGLRGAIVSSEQIDEFRREGALWLLARSEVRQLYEGAGHRTPIVRVLQIATHEVNPADFVERRRAAYASAHVMLRDTPEGYRYLMRDPAASGGDTVEPQVAGRALRVRTLAGGVLIDPNINQPLPFAGLSYVDFDLFGTGTQLNAFAGGTYGQLAFSVPSLGGSRWQVAGRAFGIATAYNDRAFVAGRERYDHNIEQRPAHVSVWLLHPLTTTMTARAGYDLDYTHFARGGGTAADFVVPQSQLIHGARLALDAQRAGWAASIWWNPARRQGWRRWGVRGSGEYDASHRDFQRYGASLARSIILRPGLVGRLEAAWMSGHDLDRFSRYAFGSFDNRLRGYPSALIRYDRGGVLRGAMAWAAGGRLRIDGFVDTAAAHDPSFGPGLRTYTGLGAALETPAPFGTLVAVEWGYGFRGVNTDGSLGTQVVRISAFKIF